MANFFDKGIIARPVEPVSNTSFFDRGAVIPVSKDKETPTSTESSQPSTALQGTDPYLVSERMPDTEVADIAKRHNIPTEALRNWVPYTGILPETVSAADIGKAGLGIAGNIAMGIPQKLALMAQNPKMEAALDELFERARKRKSYAQATVEAVAPALFTGGATAAAKGSATVGRAIAEGAAIGAGAGFGASKAGEELKEATVGSVGGAALGAAAHKLGKVIQSRLGSKALESKVTTAESEINLTKGAEEIANKRAASEEILDKSLFTSRTPLSQDEVNIVLKEQISPETLSKLLDPATVEGTTLRNIVLEELPEEAMTAGVERVISRKLAQDTLESRAVSFAEELTGSKPASYAEAVQEIDNIASRQGPQAIRDKYAIWNQAKQAEQYIAETGSRATAQPGFGGRAANFISDNQFVLRHLDDKYGSKLEPALSEASSNFNKSTYALQKFRKDQEDIFNGARKLGADDTVVNTTKVYDALNTGQLESLSPAEQKVAQAFRTYLDEVRSFANNLVKEKHPNIRPLAIPYHANYVPQQMKSIPETVGILESRIDRVKQIASQQLGREIKDIGQLRDAEFSALSKNQNITDLIDAVRIMDAKADINTPAALSARLKELMYSREGNIALESVARAAMERKGGIPDFLLEKNLYKLIDKYTANTLRHLYMRAPLDKLRLQAGNLRKLGADVEAEYVENIVRDVLGVRKGTAAEAMLQARIQAHRRLDGLIEKAGKDTVKGGALLAVKAAPELLEGATRQIYSNVLGYYNLRAVTQNATQSLTKLAPELGTKYGYTAILRGAPYTLLNWSRLLKKAESLGTVPAEFSRQGQRAISEGIMRSSLYAIPRNALEGMSKAGMFLYQKMEQFNRALTLGTAEIMAYDISKGSRLAKRALTKFPTTIQQDIIRAGNNAEEIGNILGRYLNDVTQYNYNRVSLSEFGRTLGPFFSTFSKWPTATAGDIIYELRKKGVLKGLERSAEKYVAPMLLLQAMHYAMVGEDGKLSDIQKKFVGSKGLPQAAPIGAIGALATGEIFTPPASDAITQTVILPAMERDFSKSKRGAASALQNFTPGAGMVRLLTDDLVTYLTGTRPEGSDFLERTKEGARIIERKLK